MYQDRQENLNNQNLQHQILVYSYDRIEVFPVNQKLLAMNVEQVCKNIIQPQMGYSSRIYLYKQPICSFNKINYYLPSSKISEIMKQVGVICFNYNNTQYAEQPDYYTKYTYTITPSQDSIQTVIQICQNNFFAHENYRVLNSTKIGFLKNASNRFGNNIHIQYYNTRLNINQFSDDSIIYQTIQRFLDGMKRLTITVDSAQGMSTRVSQVFQQISKDFKIQTNNYFKLCVIQSEHRIKYFAIHRKCKVQSLRYLIKINYKSQVSLTYQNSKQQIKEKYVTGESLVIAQFKLQQKKIMLLQNPIQNCQVIGTIGDLKNNNLEVIIIKLSCILYKISIDLSTFSCYPSSIAYLPCISTSHLDEDLFFIRDGQLVGYGITINMIKVKYYSFTGELLMLKVFPWYQQYEIQFSVVDMFCVKIKNDTKKKIRVFFIDNPQNYLQIGPCTNFYPAKIGNNACSDGSGLFAVTNPFYQTLQIHSLVGKMKITQFKFQNFRLLTDVFFSWQNQKKRTRKVFLNFNNKQIVIYNLFNTQKIMNILCEKEMNNFFCIGLQLACNIGNQLKLFKIEQGQKQGQYTFRWGQPTHIPNRCAIIVDENKILVRQKELKFNVFNKFYIMT